MERSELQHRNAIATEQQAEIDAIFQLLECVMQKRLTIFSFFDFIRRLLPPRDRKDHRASSASYPELLPVIVEFVSAQIAQQLQSAALQSMPPIPQLLFLNDLSPQFASAVFAAIPPNHRVRSEWYEWCLCCGLDTPVWMHEVTVPEVQFWREAVNLSQHLVKERHGVKAKAHEAHSPRRERIQATLQSSLESLPCKLLMRTDFFEVRPSNALLSHEPCNGESCHSVVVPEQCTVLPSRERVPFMLARLCASATPANYIDEEKICDGGPWLARNRCLEFSIVKSNDDLRQEYLAMQFLHLFNLIWRQEPMAVLPGTPPVCLEVPTYRITLLHSVHSKHKRSRDRSVNGIVEVIRRSASVSSIRCMSPDPSSSSDTKSFFEQFLAKQFLNDVNKHVTFLRTFTASCIACYVLQLKDRHNANILLTEDGMWINVDFGFWLERAPGGMFSLETAAFKFPSEVFSAFFGDSMSSEAFSLFQKNYVRGIELLRPYVNDLCAIVSCLPQTLWHILPCSNGCSSSEVCRKLQQRIFDDKEFVDDVRRAVHNGGTENYDAYQYRANGVR